MTRHQAHRTLRIDARYVGLALMLVSAAVVTAAIWFAFVLVAAMAQYVPSLP